MEESSDMTHQDGVNEWSHEHLVSASSSASSAVSSPQARLEAASMKRTWFSGGPVIISHYCGYVVGPCSILVDRLILLSKYKIFQGGMEEPELDGEDADENELLSDGDAYEVVGDEGDLEIIVHSETDSDSHDDLTVISEAPNNTDGLASTVHLDHASNEEVQLTVKDTGQIEIESLASANEMPVDGQEDDFDQHDYEYSPSAMDEQEEKLPDTLIEGYDLSEAIDEGMLGCLCRFSLLNRMLRRLRQYKVELELAQSRHMLSLSSNTSVTSNTSPSLSISGDDRTSQHQLEESSAGAQGMGSLQEWEEWDLKWVDGFDVMKMEAELFILRQRQLLLNQAEQAGEPEQVPDPSDLCDSMKALQYYHSSPMPTSEYEDMNDTSADLNELEQSEDESFSVQVITFNRKEVPPIHCDVVMEERVYPLAYDTYHEIPAEHKRSLSSPHDTLPHHQKRPKQ